MAQELHSKIQARKIRLSLYEYEDENEKRRSLIQKYFFQHFLHSRSILKALLMMIYGKTTMTSHFNDFSCILIGCLWLNYLRVVHCYFVTNNWLH